MCPRAIYYRSLKTLTSTSYRSGNNWPRVAVLATGIFKTPTRRPRRYLLLLLRAVVRINDHLLKQQAVSTRCLGRLSSAIAAVGYRRCIHHYTTGPYDEPYVAEVREAYQHYVEAENLTGFHGVEFCREIDLSPEGVFKIPGRDTESVSSAHFL